MTCSQMSQWDGVTVILGSQWGDEGKGKLVDVIAQEADVVARCQGGANAGHTIVVDGKSFDFHMLPSGLVNEKCISVIGNGVVVHLETFFKELEKTEQKGISCEGRILISNRAHLVFDVHQIVDGLRESERGCSNIGTTRKGIGPAYSAKASRSGLRVHDLFHFDSFEKRFREFALNRAKRYGSFSYDVEIELQKHREFATRLRGMVIDSVLYVNEAITQKKNVLVEGANAAMLDLDFGTYPYVTSSSTTVGGVLTGLGIAPRSIGRVIGVVKAYTTRVGGGPFPTELENELGERLRKIGAEYGVTTGRPRRCGWLDTVVLRYSNMLNGYTSVNLTKLDVLTGFSELKIAASYIMLDGREIKGYPADLNDLAGCKVIYETMPGWNEDITKVKNWQDLPETARNYVRKIEQLVGFRVEWVGVGPGRDAIFVVPQIS